MNRILAAGLIAAAALGVGGPGLRAADPPADEEQQIGQEVFNELKARAAIVSSSPLYDVLRPVVAPIMKAAQPRYGRPFSVYLVHDPRPNAFAVPGGNVYVTDELLYFVRNTEELAGTVCHEVAHTIRRDAIKRMEEEQRRQERGLGAAILLGPTPAKILAISLISKLSSLSYSRDIESGADVVGSDVCVAAGYNPWGLVWLFEEFQNADPKQIPELLSDHPANGARIELLEKHFHDNPAVFSTFDRNPKSATPFSAPKDAAERFLPASADGR